ncbi:MAG TPA: papain-like cysteine protease family protein [Chitinophagaceae bacterium]|jgi:papain like cysteine protease AvrRpt2|nr:papain-like cysteine protease family protein [Chitinophagaceae bacterium]
MPDSISYLVPGAEIIPVEAQDKSMACWATVLTMLASWKNQQCYSIETATEMIGEEYKKIYKENTGLYPDKVEGFASASGLKIEWPQCSTPENIRDLLESYGPIAVIDDEDPSSNFCVHARLVTGIHGDGTDDHTYLKILDPDGGQTYDEAFDVFESKYESMAEAQGWTIQMLHY